MMSPEEAYKHDHTFRRMVDIMRQELTLYSITPAELRQAAILAAAMHESQHIRPLLMTKDKFDWTYVDEAKIMAKIIPPAMFGGTTSGRYPTASGAVEQVEKKPTESEHCHFFRASGYSYDVCDDCGMSDVYYNWAYNKRDERRAGLKDRRC